MPDNIHVTAGTAGHSAWFSEDAGASWVHPNSHSGMYLEARVWALASHAATPDALYAGTDMGGVSLERIGRALDRPALAAARRVGHRAAR